MSEFDNFESAAAAEDPAAAFLASSEDQLAALEGDGVPTSEDVAQDFLDVYQTESENLAASGETQAFGDMFGGTTSGGEFGTTTQSSFSDTPASGETAAEGSLFDPLSGGASESDQQPTDFQPAGLDSEPSFAGAAETGDGYSAISQMDTQRAEPEKIRIWREEQKERLQKKDEESEVRKKEWRQAAKKELEDWYKHRNEQLEKTKANNREAEAVFVQERDESTPGHEWEKICRLCEFNPKQARNTKDISRFRSILLQLKQTPLVR